MQPYRQPKFAEVAELLLAVLERPELGRTERIESLAGAMKAAYYIGRQASAEQGDDAGEILLLPSEHQLFIFDAMTSDIPKRQDHHTGSFTAMLTGLVEPPKISVIHLRRMLVAIHAPCSRAG